MRFIPIYLCIFTVFSCSHNSDSSVNENWRFRGIITSIENKTNITIDGENTIGQIASVLIVDSNVLDKIGNNEKLIFEFNPLFKNVFFDAVNMQIYDKFVGKYYIEGIVSSKKPNIVIMHYEVFNFYPIEIIESPVTSTIEQ